MKKRNIMLAFLCLLALSFIIAGCSTKQKDRDGFALPVAAYQFAKSEVQVLLSTPNAAVFPMISEGIVIIEELEDNMIIVTSSVSYNDFEVDHMVSKNFTVVLKHLGNGIFQTNSIDFE